MTAICTVFVYVVSFFILYVSIRMCAIVTLSLKATYLLTYLLTIRYHCMEQSTRNCWFY